MQVKASQSILLSSKLNLKLLTQFVYHNNSNLGFCALVIDIFFSNFTHLNIKLLICCLFVFDQLLGGRPFLLKLSRYKVKREKRTSLTIRWTINSLIFVYKLFMVLLPKISKDGVYLPTVGNVISRIKLNFSTILIFIPHLQNYRQFSKFFEFENIIISFSFSLLHLKHNLVLKNYLSYVGFLIV